ncbi:MAG: KdsC family phosphatase [Planctomycetota bacterium]|jgi:3-deoxy-D-manno-octulosonate 8-phosphate phosphatase (KDO 8-P phosphatase)
MAIPIDQCSTDRLSPIRLLVLDVDGVLSDGRLLYGADATELKAFHTHDGAGIKYWHRAGMKTAIISGRASASVTRRASELGIEEVHLDAKDKAPVLEALLTKLNVAPEHTAYMGDDLPDIPPMRMAGLRITVPNAVPEVKDFAHVVTVAEGGAGAVREAIDALLKANGRWPAILARYFPELA